MTRQALIYHIADCEWGEWSFGECSKTCGEGTRSKSRNETVSAICEGEECVGPASDVESCNELPCGKP